MEQESSLICKKLKFMTSLQQDNPRPLGLMLRKTPSFLSLLETKLSYERISCTEPRKKERYSVIAQGINKKIKASNFSASLLQIGSWERVSRYEGQLVAKCYYAKKKLVWEFLDQGLKNKVEFLWSDIASLKATFDVNKPDTLEIELLAQPYFFKETNPQPRKHTLWKTTDDFTNGQASICRRHFLQFPQGGLQKHYEKLLRSDSRLSLLSKKSFPSSDSPFFSPNVIQQFQSSPSYQSFLFGGKNLNDLKLPFEKEASSDYTELLHDSVSRTFSVLQHPVSRSLRTSSGSVINLPPVKEKLEGDFNQQYWSKAPFLPARLTRISNLTTMAPVPRMIPSEVSLTQDNSMFGSKISFPCTEGGEIDNNPGKVNHCLDYDCSGICSKSFCQILEAPANQTFMLPVSDQSEMDRTNVMGFHILNRNKNFEQLG
ncbi:uncharacterized protein [Aristolochia californica]|uniref:uncharacterized protein n=1 Tax=Aristolochia californica TaxID=171875 RepID=UPI0035D8075F